ncbi:MAG: fimbrial biogenesis chaperone [Serratia bockelmannii]
MKAYLLALFVFLLSFSGMTLAQEGGGFSLGKTRVIYNEGGIATVDVNNTADGLVFLAQSWVTELDGRSAPFIVTPPVYRQTQGSNRVRIIRSTGLLPEDRESTFWLNVKAIPAATQKKENQLSFAYVIKIKLFYRPKGLTGKPGDAYEKLTFSRSGNTLTATNPTPYYITFNKISVGGKNIKDVNAMVPPLGSQSYIVPAGATGNITYKTINDYGGLTPDKTVSL